MSHYYGVMLGSRGKATRTGSKNSGLTVTAASWKGSIEVRLWNDKEGDHFEIIQQPWQGAGVSQTIAIGMLGEMVRK